MIKRARKFSARNMNDPNTETIPSLENAISSQNLRMPRAIDPSNCWSGDSGITSTTYGFRGISDEEASGMIAARLTSLIEGKSRFCSC